MYITTKATIGYYANQDFQSKLLWKSVYWFLEQGLKYFTLYPLSGECGIK